LAQQGPEDRSQRDQRQRGHQDAEGLEDQVGDTAAGGFGGAHYWAPPGRSSSRAKPSTAKVMRNRTRPSAIRAAVCTGLVASVNSLAMVDAIVEPLSNSDFGKAC